MRARVMLSHSTAVKLHGRSRFGGPLRRHAVNPRHRFIGAVWCLVAMLLLAGGEVRAQFTFAEDVASNYNGSGEPTFGTGANGGSGFEAWSFTTGGSAGGFIGNPADAGIGGMSTESFGLFANPTNSGNFIDVDRDLASAIQIGDTFSFDWGVNFDADGPGTKGFNLYVGGVEVINVDMAGSETITVNGTDTGFGYGTNVMTWSFYYADATTLVVTANDRDGSGSYSNNFTVAGGIDSFQWYAAQLSTNSTDQRQPYYNNLLVTNSGVYDVATERTESRYLTGSGSLAKTGVGTLTISGTSNNFTGTVGITNGAIRATTDNALGATNGATTVESGATLEVSGGITLADDITITGSGVGDGGAIRSLGDGENTLSGTITLGGDARINVDAPLGSVTALAGWGTNDFTVEPGATTLTIFSQTATTMTMSGTPGIGDTLGGYLPVSDWSSVSNFGVQMSITGTNNNLPFTLALYDGDFNVANTYAATTEGIGATPGVVLLDLISAGSGILTNVSGLQFTWDASAAINATFSSLVSVPTSGLVISGNVSAGANVLALGAAAGPSGTVADGIRMTGAISGSGGTYEGTATTLVKDGGGTVYLSGNNTFTGDTRILDGVLSITPTASTNALGIGSDLFVSAFAELEVAGNVSVSSIQGEGAVRMQGGKELTVNGAGKTMTLAGNISGQGGVRLSGDASTLLTLTGDNTFTGVTRVVAGTLALEGSGGNQALSSTDGVIVSSGAKLLLNASDQVFNSADMTLSGGTIQRGSGVSDVFGNLVLTTDSFLDYGTGETGTLRFGNYTPSSLLTVNNFLPGNKLQFGNTISSTDLENASLFSFSSGFTTGTESGFFTITAIPEPSSYVAAAGLVVLLLCSSRRRALRLLLRGD